MRPREARGTVRSEIGSPSFDGVDHNGRIRIIRRLEVRSAHVVIVSRTRRMMTIKTSVGNPGSIGGFMTPGFEGKVMVAVVDRWMRPLVSRRSARHVYHVKTHLPLRLPFQRDLDIRSLLSVMGTPDVTSAPTPVA
jgi:hypothetical protein